MCELIYGNELKNLNNLNGVGAIIYLTLDLIQMSVDISTLYSHHIRG
jgi:hypothetical protein